MAAFRREGAAGGNNVAQRAIAQARGSHGFGILALHLRHAPAAFTEQQRVSQQPVARFRKADDRAEDGIELLRLHSGHISYNEALRGEIDADHVRELLPPLRHVDMARGGGIALRVEKLKLLGNGLHIHRSMSKRTISGDCSAGTCSGMMPSSGCPSAAARAAPARCAHGS